MIDCAITLATLPLPGSATPSLPSNPEDTVFECGRLLCLLSKHSKPREQGFFILLRSRRILLNKVNSHSAAPRHQVRTKAYELVSIELVINLGHPTLSSTHPSLAPETGEKITTPQ